MAASAPTAAADITQDERTMSILAHILQLVGWVIAPLIIFAIRRNSRFVCFHALQAVLLQCVYMLLGGSMMAVWFTFMLTTVFKGSANPHAAPPAILFLVFPLIWLGFMGMYALLYVVAILYAIKAGRGEWAEYPVLGRMARRILHIGPNGAYE